MPIAKMYWTKEVERGIKKYRITKLEGFLKEYELPVEYVSNPPYMVLYEDYVRIYVPEGANLATTTVCTATGSKFTVTPGDLIKESRMAEARKWMGICGNRLAKINRKLEIENAEWQGDGVFEI